MSKRIFLVGALIAALSAAFPAESSAQARARVAPRRVVVVGAYASPFYYRPWFYDPWFYDPFFYDPWFDGYGYGPYRRYGYADASMRLEVKPKQAEVFVDGYYAGIVDDFDGTFQRLHVQLGEHEITLYLDGYRTVHQKLYLTPDNTFKLKYQMERLSAGEQPEPRPQPTEPPPTLAGAPSGPPQPYPGPGRAPAGRRPPQTMPRDPRGAQASAYGTLAIRVQPADVDVLIDGEKWSGPEGQERLMIDVPEGRHTIEIRKSGYRTYVTNVEVRRGEATPLNVSLRSQEEQ